MTLSRYKSGGKPNRKWVVVEYYAVLEDGPMGLSVSRGVAEHAVYRRKMRNDGYGLR